METFLVIAPGPYVTVQDAGRVGYQDMGVPLSGALDPFAFRMANLLVGNAEDCAVLEMTVVGPQLAVLRETDIAITGAQMGLKLNFEAVPCWQTLRVRPGDMLSVQPVTSGCRGYLAVTGGFDVPKVMGSRSTFVGAQIGGFHGRALQKGDILARGPGALLDTPRRVPDDRVPRHTDEIVLRAVPGPQDDFFDEGLKTLFGSVYTVTENADRQGYRLQGPPIAHRQGVPKSIISEPTIPGGIQVPADLQPIILLVEQTVGGYTKIATVISTDLPKVAQATPGVSVRFEAVSLAAAHRIHQEQRAVWAAVAREITGT